MTQNSEIDKQKSQLAGQVMLVQQLTTMNIEKKDKVMHYQRYYQQKADFIAQELESEFSRNEEIKILKEEVLTKDY